MSRASRSFTPGSGMPFAGRTCWGCRSQRTMLSGWLGSIQAICARTAMPPRPGRSGRWRRGCLESGGMRRNCSARSRRGRRRQHPPSSPRRASASAARPGGRCRRPKRPRRRSPRRAAAGRSAVQMACSTFRGTSTVRNRASADQVHQAARHPHQQSRDLLVLRRRQPERRERQPCVPGVPGRVRERH